jgi:lipopolysaccharide export system permease protein
MGSIGRYIFRAILGAFLIVLVGLTGAVWLTEALRDLDLMTSQGQTILNFIAITSLIIPHLVLVIAPFALLVAIVHVLQKLSTDSELIVMNSAGMSPSRLLRPFLAATILVSLLLAPISAYVAPESLQTFRRWLIEVRTDLISNIVQPGRFIAIESGLAFNIRERQPNGLLVGILLDDRRDRSERVTILAERGEIYRTESGSFLILENGNIQRHERGKSDPNIVIFDRYAFDLSPFGKGNQDIRYSVRERYLWQLMWPDAGDRQHQEQPGQFRAELHDRLLAPIYPIVFVVIAFAFLGAPRTMRQNPAWSVTAVILGVAAVRLIGFASTVFAVRYPIALLFEYAAVAGALAAGTYAISRGIVIEPPTRLTEAVNAAGEWLLRRAGAIVRPSQ